MAEMKDSFNEVTAEMLKVISDYDSVTGFQGAYNIRQDSMCAGRKNSENITIESKTDKPGINIRVKPGTKGETVYIPACVTHSDVDDLVYNDFFIGEGADVTIVAGCGVHSDGSETARHNGIHRFFLEKGAKVLYKEKHIGIGGGPINLAVLYFFFSMDSKTAALNSLYIILFSQTASFFSTVFQGKVPEFNLLVLIVMMAGGVLGGFVGRAFSKKMSGAQVDTLFRWMLVLITAITCYNLYHYASML